MFSGIIEACEPILSIQEKNQALEIQVRRPAQFDDIHLGDSISSDGCCLTVENLTAESMQFTLGAETLKVLSAKLQPHSSLLNKKLNLERSLKFGDRIHGHLVTGHVDGLTQIKEKTWMGDCLILKFEVPAEVSKFCWKKGSITLNGVSLTVNEKTKDLVEVCLIPETLKRTNLAELEVGQYACTEGDYMAKAAVSSLSGAIANMKELV